MAESDKPLPAFHAEPPPAWALAARKTALQHLRDAAGAPLRMVLLPDHGSERLHLTSLRAERFRAVLPELKGRVLDVGCGDNMLLKLYEARDPANAGRGNVGVDVEAWTSDVLPITNSAELPFEDGSFDTVAFVACLNHIPEREAALVEARRVLRPGGRIVVTMIGRLIGKVGHALWWYSEDKHRDLHPDELMGMDPAMVLAMLERAGLSVLTHRRFVYRLNHLFVAERR